MASFKTFQVGPFAGPRNRFGVANSSCEETWSSVGATRQEPGPTSCSRCCWPARPHRGLLDVSSTSWQQLPALPQSHSWFPEPLSTAKLTVTVIPMAGCWVEGASGSHEIESEKDFLSKYLKQLQIHKAAHLVLGQFLCPSKVWKSHCLYQP